jgi:hypothetical protein
MARILDSLMSHQHAEDRLSNPDCVAAIEWARDLMVSRDFVILDSETIGLSSPDSALLSAPNKTHPNVGQVAPILVMLYSRNEVWP